LEISTPGRICLFGEHQDYLGLPVVSMAISLRVNIVGEKRQDRKIVIHKPDLKETETFSLDNLDYTNNRDYFKSGIRICQRMGISFVNGVECEIKSKIPFQAGTSSSSAIVVGWINFLAQLVDPPPKWSTKKIGGLAYLAESVEFGEPGGMMDQYTTACGGLLKIESEPNVSLQKIESKLGSFVLGDSCEPKKTLEILYRCKNLRMNILDKLTSVNPNFDLHTSTCEEDISCLDKEEQSLFYATLKNRDLLERSLIELRKEKIDHQYIGDLLNQEHEILRDDLNVSTNKIESMLSASLSAGAFGGKINGSGGGGCMFAYAPKNSEAVASAIESVGGRAYIIGKDEGTKILSR
tara:strand:+ start:1992 stop:3047 length:1056 start_codon:yes stop_codon:yes gene_type:complete